MNSPPARLRSARLRPAALALLGGLCLGLLGPGCSPPPPAGGPGAGGPRSVLAVGAISLPKAEPRPGTAVVVLVDTSGSMEQDVPDQDRKMRPKYQIAHDALQRIIDTTARWRKEHAGSPPVYLGIYHFSSLVYADLPVAEFDQGKAEAALNAIPRPNGGTAIGLALQEGFKGLYRSGCNRKFLVCITDGMNTAGPAPEPVARQLHAQTGGEVELHFVAFDTSATQFKFLNGVNGHAVEAKDGGQLQAELSRIYEKRILAEAPDEPQK
jgi:von Willebrand factor type A domain